MNPTHDQEHKAPKPVRHGGWLARLLTDKDRFRAWIATATGTASEPVDGPTASAVLGLPMTDAARRRYALREAGYTGWIDQDGYARTDDEVDAWSALMNARQSGYLRSVGGGYVLTDVGREALDYANAATEFRVAQALRHGVQPSQIDTGWDGPWFEWMSDQDTDAADGYGERLAERCLDQRDAADLREMQDRFAVTASGVRALEEAGTAEAPGTVGFVLRSAALYLERHGWIQGAYYDGTTGVFTPPADVVGAIAMVCYGGPCEAPAQHFDDPGFLDFEEAVLHLDRYLLVEDGTESYEFNDARGRTREHITGVLRKAAARSADDLIGCLRAIAEQEITGKPDLIDRVKLLTPGGIWAEGLDAEEPTCFCVDGFVCVYCSSGGDA